MFNEIYADQCESDNDSINLVRQLDENEKVKSENVNNLEELLRKSRQLNSSKSVRLIDQQIDSIPLRINKSIENLVLSCNILDKNKQIDPTLLTNQIQYLELGGNFLKSIDGIKKETNQLQSLGLGFNEINQIFSLPKWPNLCLIDLSYNLLNDLYKTIQSFQNLNKLRILFLHGNPLALLMDYRLYVVDSLPNLLVLDDVTITAEERFRSRTFSNSDQHPKANASITISFGTIFNVPPPPTSQSEWPIRTHRYKMSIDWFEGEKEEYDIPFDKMANFNRFNPSKLESSYSDYKANIDLSPNSLNMSINTLIPFRDFLFHGTKCRFIHQMTEYWQPGEITEGNEQKKKSNLGGDAKDKKSDSPVKKKKAEDLTKLVTRTDPIETILAEFFVDLRPFLDGDYRASSSFKSILQQQIDSQNQEPVQTKSTKKALLNKTESPQDKKRISSSKSNKDKTKDKKQINENETETIPTPEPFQCSINFQLHRYLQQQQIV